MDRLRHDLYWCGKRLTDMSRDELLDVVMDLNRRLESYQTPEAIRASSIGRVQMMKRGGNRGDSRF